MTVKGFKGIREMENLELRPLNVLIGANGAGKSNFLSVFELLRNLDDGPLAQYVAVSGGANRILHFGSERTRRIEVSIQVTTGGIKAVLVPTSTNSLYLTYEHMNMVQMVPETFLGSLRTYHFADAGPLSRIRQTADIHDNSFLRGDGRNLAAILFLLKEKYPAALRQIRTAVQQVAPFLEDFALTPLQLNPKTIRLAWRHVGGDDYLDADSFSDGTLRFIALATLLYLPSSLRPPVFLLDEPELGLHPAAISLLTALLRKAAVDTQVIVSTQSPQLLDEFEPEDVLVVDRVEGATQVRRLEAAPLIEWLQDYRLGQLWEKNQFGGRPVSSAR